jgi:PAS domain S-box-containing protein
LASEDGLVKKENKLDARSIDQHSQLMNELERFEKQWSLSTKRDRRHHERVALRISEAMITHDLDGNILDCNKKHSELFGYTRNEIRRLKLQHFHPPEKIPELAAMVEKIQKHSIVHFETPMLKKNGELFPASVTAVIRESNKGLLCQSLIRDLSEREKIQRELKASKRKHQWLLELFFDAIIIHQNERILETNQHSCEMLGYSEGQLLRMTISDLYDPSEHDRVKKQIHRSRKNIHCESRWKKADGDIIDVEIFSTITDHENGITTSMIRDITGRKQIEAKIRDSEQQFRSIFNNSLDGIILLGPDDKPLMANPAFCRMHGYTAEEVFSLHGRDFIDEDQKTTVFLNTLSRKGHFTGEVTAIQKDGTRFPSESAAKAVINSRNEICLLVITRDISHQKNIERELETARKTAEKASRVKSEFLANMSHEIRTPLNGVMGVLNLLLNTELNHEQLDLLHTGQRCANSLLTIITDILDFSKIEADQLDLEIVDFNLRDTIAEIVEVPVLQAQKKGLAFICRIQPEIPALLRGDPSRLCQIIHNLIGNAVKFTSRGEIVLKISLETETDTQVDIRFEVSDTGIGIPQEKLMTIFEPFKQSAVSTSRRYGGTGLGLTISKRLVNMMDGDIGVTSTENRGSTFHFNILFEKRDESKTVMPASSEEIQGKGFGFSGYLTKPTRQSQLYACLTRALSDIKQTVATEISGEVEAYAVSHHQRKRQRILIVEDNPINQKLARKMVTQFGFHVDCCSNGKEALDALEKAAYNLILMDIQMPIMDGLEATRIIRAPESKVKNHAVKIIAMTAYAMQGDKERCLEAGMNDYISKPIQPDELLNAIEKQILSEE